MANCHAIINHGLQVRPDDRGTSWLPLYHDMGLVGFMLAPLLCQLSVDYLTTRDFARRALLWLTLMSRNGGTLSYSPTFGYDLCSRRAATGATLDIDLRRWRAAGVGGDMVQPDVLARFAETFAPYGFRETAFVPSYGMAETTLAISFAPLDTGVEVDVVDRRRMAEERLAVPERRSRAARGFVPAGGRCLNVAEIRGDGADAGPPRRAHFVKGPSVMAGISSAGRRGMCSTRTVGSIPAISATRSTAISSSPDAPRTSSSSMAAISGRRTWSGLSRNCLACAAAT
jgi:fatty-acyl-CoA synthase